MQWLSQNSVKKAQMESETLVTTSANKSIFRILMLKFVWISQAWLGYSAANCVSQFWKCWYKFLLKTTPRYIFFFSGIYFGCLWGTLAHQNRVFYHNITNSMLNSENQSIKISHDRKKIVGKCFVHSVGHQLGQQDVTLFWKNCHQLRQRLLQDPLETPWLILLHYDE